MHGDAMDCVAPAPGLYPTPAVGSASAKLVGAGHGSLPHESEALPGRRRGRPGHLGLVPRCAAVRAQLDTCDRRRAPSPAGSEMSAQSKTILVGRPDDHGVHVELPCWLELPFKEVDAAIVEPGCEETVRSAC